MKHGNEPIRVLHVLGALDFGGAETMVMNLYRSIDRNKLQFDFVIHTSAQCDYTNEILKLGGKIYSCPRYVGSNHYVYCKWWRKFLAEHKEYKVIHGHISSVASIYLLIAKKMNRITIAHSHSASNGNGVKAMVRWILQYPIRYIADYMFACSDEAGIRLYGKKTCKGKRYYFFPNAINISDFQYDEAKRDEIRKILDIKEKLVIGTVGRISEAKNPYGILDIFGRVKEKGKAVLLWIGTGELENEIKNEAVKRELTDRILFMGNRADVPVLLQGIDVFIFPSLWEGLPVAVIEAQAAGIPCLVSDRVTRKVAVSKLVHYLPIDKGYEIWANAILDMKLDRQDVKKEIKQAGFDINDSAMWLQEFYESLQK